MIRRTTGIVLRVSPFSRTSHVVTWLTADYGRLATVVKGAVRPRSLFLGQYDLFYKCELLFYSRERNGAHIIRECSPIETRNGLRANWRATVCASYFSELANGTGLPGIVNVALFQLLDSALRFLESGRADCPLVYWFELKALDAIGLSPRLTRCSSCDRQLSAVPGATEFSYSGGGIVCPQCSRKSDTPSVRIGEASLAAMQRWQSSPLPAPADTRTCGDKQLAEIGRILEGFLQYHAQMGMKGRTIAMEMLQYSVKL